jgi:hypothetical protein
MFEINLKIISELKAFIDICIANPVVLNVFRRSEQDFTRNRKLSFQRLVLFITKLCKKTLSVELDQFFEAELKEPMSCSVSAFCQQRLKLDSSFFCIWNEVLWQSFYHYGREHIRRWRGYRLVAADGSCICLVNTTALSGHFGGQRNQNISFTCGRAFFHYDVLNKLFIDARLAPYRTSEQNMAYRAMDTLSEDMLTIYDRYHCNYKTVALLRWAEKEHRFVIRAREKYKLIASFIDRGQLSEVVTMYPTRSNIESMRKSGLIVTPKTPLKVRLVRVELEGGNIEVLLTNLWEEEGYGHELFRELYFMRWGVETAISIQKNLLQLESFSGLSVESVYQDFFATVFMANLAALLARHVTDEQRAKSLESQSPGRGREGMRHLAKWPYQVNMNKATGRLRQRVVGLFITDEPVAILQELSAYFNKHLLPIRKGRSYTRYRKNKQSFSRHKTFSNYKPPL